jgi:hypothetical protein
MSGVKDIKNAIRQIANNRETVNVVCKVKSVDLTAKTCRCVPIDGTAELLNVRLIANNETGVLLIPEVNSVVIVSLIVDGAGYVSMFSGVSEVQLNGDNFQGLVKVQDLITQLNTLQTEINTLKTLTFTAISVYSAAIDGGLSANIFNLATLPQISTATLENTTVKHGNGN